MGNKPQRAPRLAVAIIVGALVVAAAIIASTSLRPRTTATATQTVTTTSLTTTTISVSSPSSSTAQLATSTLFTSVGTGSAVVLNSSDGLGLGIQVVSNPDGNYTITVRESNLLNSVNNITEADAWNYSQNSLSPCGPPNPPAPVELAVAEGRYGQNNYTSNRALPFYNPSIPSGCARTTYTPPDTYAFQPLNDTFSFYGGTSTYPIRVSGGASVTLSTNGYWTTGETGATAAFIPFSPGVYTVIGADEWGNVVLLQFSVP